MNKFIEYLCKLFILVVFFRSTFPSDEIYDATHAKYSDFKTYDSKRGNKTMNVKCSRTIGITCIHSNSEICLYFPIFILSKIRYLCRFYRFFCKVRIGKNRKISGGDEIQILAHRPFFEAIFAHLATESWPFTRTILMPLVDSI